MRYIPELDGIRAVAVLIVMAFHARAPGFGGGFFGVDIFFVLSGFLITSILYSEVSETGTISLRNFYLRRLLRLTPALILCLSLYLILAPLFFPDYLHHLRDAFLAAVYLSDYSFAFWRVPNMLQHTWSLSVEEHFYLVLPALILLLKRFRTSSLSGLTTRQHDIEY